MRPEIIQYTLSDVHFVERFDEPRFNENPQNHDSPEINSYSLAQAAQIDPSLKGATAQSLLSLFARSPEHTIRKPHSRVTPVSAVYTAFTPNGQPDYNFPQKLELKFDRFLNAGQPQKFKMKVTLETLE
jgi:hypothetical protein